MKRTLLLFTGIIMSVLSMAQPTTGDYRSKQSGDWNNPGSWQTYNGTLWTDASVNPTEASGEITIQNSHEINYTAIELIDQVVIAAGGKLLASSGNFNLTNGAGIDLKIYGTFQWNSGWAGYCGTWEIYSGGIVNINCGSYGTGVLTSATINAVKLFQGTHKYHCENSVVPYGKIGAITWRSLFGNETKAVHGQALNIYLASNLCVSASQIGIIKYT
ncbi:MAG: hypothetical protein ABJB86_15230 [Bacteroidota bacterium]